MCVEPLIGSICIYVSRFLGIIDGTRVHETRVIGADYVGAWELEPALGNGTGARPH